MTRTIKNLCAIVEDHGFDTNTINDNTFLVYGAAINREGKSLDYELVITERNIQAAEVLDGVKTGYTEQYNNIYHYLGY